MPDFQRPVRETLRLEVLRGVLLLALMVACAAGAWLLTPSKKLADRTQKIDLESAIPRQFGQWVIDDTIIPVNPSPQQQATLAQIYDQTVNRTYKHPNGARVMLSIAYGSAQTNELRAHRQEVCYTAQGFQISRLQHVDVNMFGQTLRATRMVAAAGRRVEPVTYWFTMGDKVVLSFADRQLAQLKYSLSGLIPDGYLFRVSTLGDDPAAAYVVQQQFAQELLSAVSPSLRAKLTGSL